MDMMNKTQKKRFEKTTSIKYYDFFCKNEIMMSKIITNQMDYQFFFSLVIGYKKVKMSENSSLLYENQIHETIRMDKIYLSMDYYIPGAHLTKTFSDYYGFSSGLHDFASKKLYIMKLIRSFRFGINTINILSKHKVVHMQIFPKNIIFMSDNTTILSNFSRGFQYEKILQERNIIKEIFSIHHVNNVYLPLEAHLLSFIHEKGFSSLSASNIEEVSYAWKSAIKSSSIGCYFSEDYFIEEPFFLSLMSLINKSKREIEDKILGYSHGWNAYSYGILFLQLCRFFDNHTIEKECLFSKRLNCELQRLICIDPKERKSLNTVSQYIEDSIMSIKEPEWIEICRD